MWVIYDKRWRAEYLGSAGAEGGGAVDEALASILTVSDSQFDAKQKLLMKMDRIMDHVF
jgi:hypothetical protein